MKVMRRSRWLSRLAAMLVVGVPGLVAAAPARRSSRFEQADLQVVLPVGLGQRAGDGDGFCIPGIPVPDD